MTTPQQQVIAKCNEIFALAKELYGVDASVCQIRFDLKGRVAGQAGYKGHFGGHRQYYLRFNHDMLQRELESMLEEVVPHEIAHIVCFMNPKLGTDHDYGWQNVCRKLGGSGNRTHSMKVVYGKGKTYEYTTHAGHQVRLSEQRHKQVQTGQTLSYRGGKGKVDKHCSYIIVGDQGHTFKNPVQPKLPSPAITPVDPVVAAARTSFTIGAPVPETTAEADWPFKRPNWDDLPKSTVKPKPAVVFDPEAVAAAVAAAKAKGATARGPVTAGLVIRTGGESKADVARRLMVDGHAAGKDYETILQEIMLANGHDRRLAASYYKNNAPKVGVPLPA